MHVVNDRYLLYKQFLAHGDALIEPLLVLLQEFLLLIYLPPQVTVGLSRDKTGAVSKLLIQRRSSFYAHFTHSKQVIYSPLFFLQVQTLVALQSSKFQAR